MSRKIISWWTNAALPAVIASFIGCPVLSENQKPSIDTFRLAKTGVEKVTAIVELIDDGHIHRSLPIDEIKSIFEVTKTFEGISDSTVWTVPFIVDMGKARPPWHVYFSINHDKTVERYSITNCNPKFLLSDSKNNLCPKDEELVSAFQSASNDKQRALALIQGMNNTVIYSGMPKRVLVKVIGDKWSNHKLPNGKELKVAKFSEEPNAWRLIFVESHDKIWAYTLTNMDDYFDGVPEFKWKQR